MAGIFVIGQPNEQVDLDCTVIKKRERSENWTQDEKDFLTECIQDKKDIILNLTVPLADRLKAWVQIERSMNSAGFKRKVKHIKQQWKRMKRTKSPHALFTEINARSLKVSDKIATESNLEIIYHRILPATENQNLEIKPEVIATAPKNTIENSQVKEVFVEVVPDILLHKSTPAPADPLQSSESHEEQLQRLQIKKLETEINHQAERHELEIELLRLKKQKELLEIELLEKQLDRKETWHF